MPFSSKNSITPVDKAKIILYSYKKHMCSFMDSHVFAILFRGRIIMKKINKEVAEKALNRKAKITANQCLCNNCNCNCKMVLGKVLQSYALAYQKG